jgi:membrane protein required for colicin V production
MIGPFSYLDVALLAVAFLSGLLAMYRGLTREVLSILSWAVAAGTVLYFVLKQKPLAEEVAHQIGAPVPIAQIGMGAFLFLIVLVIVHLITARISDSILDSRVGLIDRILGFGFGVARGFVLIVIPYMFYVSFVPEPTQQFPWVRNGMFTKVIADTGETFKAVLVRYMPSSFGEPKGDQQQQG